MTSKRCFEVILSQPKNKNQTIAVLDSELYLEYNTELEPQDIGVYNEEIYGGGDNEDYGIGVYVFVRDEVYSIDEFENEVLNIKDVETIEEVSIDD